MATPFNPLGTFLFCSHGVRVGPPGRYLFIQVQPEKQNVGVGMGHLEGFIVRDLEPGTALGNLGGVKSFFRE